MVLIKIEAHYTKKRSKRRDRNFFRFLHLWFFWLSCLWKKGGPISHPPYLRGLMHFLYIGIERTLGMGDVHWVGVFHRHLCYLHMYIYRLLSTVYSPKPSAPQTINQWPAGSQALFYKGSDWDYRFASHKKSVSGEREIFRVYSTE